MPKCSSKPISRLEVLTTKIPTTTTTTTQIPTTKIATTKTSITASSEIEITCHPTENTLCKSLKRLRIAQQNVRGEDECYKKCKAIKNCKRFIRKHNTNLCFLLNGKKCRSRRKKGFLLYEMEHCDETELFPLAEKLEPEKLNHDVSPTTRKTTTTTRSTTTTTTKKVTTTTTTTTTTEKITTKMTTSLRTTTTRKTTTTTKTTKTTSTTSTTRTTENLPKDTESSECTVQFLKGRVFFFEIVSLNFILDLQSEKVILRARSNNFYLGDETGDHLYNQATPLEISCEQNSCKIYDPKKQKYLLHAM